MWSWHCRWCGRAEPAVPLPGVRVAAAAGRGRRGRAHRGGAGPRVPRARRYARRVGSVPVLDHVAGRPDLVVASTRCGATPRRAGTAAALLLDGWAMLSRPDLRVAEETLRRWMGAAALVVPAADGGRLGRVVVVADAGFAAGAGPRPVGSGVGHGRRAGGADGGRVPARGADGVRGGRRLRRGRGRRHPPRRRDPRRPAAPERRGARPRRAGPRTRLGPRCAAPANEPWCACRARRAARWRRRSPRWRPSARLARRPTRSGCDWTRPRSADRRRGRAPPSRDHDVAGRAGITTWQNRVVPAAPPRRRRHPVPTTRVHRPPGSRPHSGIRGRAPSRRRSVPVQPDPAVRRSGAAHARRAGDDFDKELRTLVADLTETMLDAPGVGLAAPADRRRAAGVHLPRATASAGHLVNPELRPLGDEEQDGAEGCLSIPGLAFDCRRRLQRGRARASTCTASRSRSRAASCWPAASSTRPTTWTACCSSTGSTRRPARRRWRAIREAEWFGGPPPLVKVSPHRCSAKPGDALRPSLGRPAMRLRLRGHTRRRRPVAASALLASPARGGRGADPAGRPGRPRAAAGRVARSARCADEAGIAGADPARPRDPEFLAALRELAPDCCPVVAYGALLPRPRWTSRGTAGSTCTSRCCPPGAARRRCSTRSGTATTSPAPPRSGSRRGWTPARCTAWSPSGPARPTPPATCSPGWPQSGAGLLVATLDGIADGTLVAAPAAGRRRVARAQDHVADARVDWAAPAVGRGPAGAGRDPRARRLDDLPRRAAQARPGAPADPTRAELSPASCASRSGGCWSGTGSGRGPARRGPRPTGGARCPRPTGPAGCGSRPARCWDERPGSGACHSARAVLKPSGPTERSEGVRVSELASESVSQRPRAAPTERSEGVRVSEFERVSVTAPPRSADRAQRGGVR